MKTTFLTILLVIFVIFGPFIHTQPHRLSDFDGLSLAELALVLFRFVEMSTLLPLFLALTIQGTKIFAQMNAIEFRIHLLLLY